MMRFKMRGDPFYELPYSNYPGSDNPDLWWISITLAVGFYIFRLVYHTDDDYLFNLILTSSASIVLIIAFFIRDSQDYFIFLRYFVSFSAFILIILSLYYKKDNFSIVLRIFLLIILIVFNPILPIYLNSRKTWQIIDYITVIILILNNVYSYNLDEPFSSERYLRIANYCKSFKGIFQSMVPLEKSKSAGIGCVSVVIIGLVIMLILTLFTS